MIDSKKIDDVTENMNKKCTKFESIEKEKKKSLCLRRKVTNCSRFSADQLQFWKIIQSEISEIDLLAKCLIVATPTNVSNLSKSSKRSSRYGKVIRADSGG